MIVSSDLTKSNHSALKRTFWVTTSGLHGLKLWGPSERAFGRRRFAGDAAAVCSVASTPGALSRALGRHHPAPR